MLTHATRHVIVILDEIDFRLNVIKVEGVSLRSDEGLTLETSAFLLFTVANLRFQPSC